MTLDGEAAACLLDVFSSPLQSNGCLEHLNIRVGQAFFLGLCPEIQQNSPGKVLESANIRGPHQAHTDYANYSTSTDLCPQVTITEPEEEKSPQARTGT